MHLENETSCMLYMVNGKLMASVKSHEVFAFVVSRNAAMRVKPIYIHVYSCNVFCRLLPDAFAEPSASASLALSLKKTNSVWSVSWQLLRKAGNLIFEPSMLTFTIFILHDGVW